MLWILYLLKPIGPYSWKWTKFSAGISLTSQTWFCSAFGLQAIFAAENTKYCKKYRQKHVYFTIISLDITNWK